MAFFKSKGLKGDFTYDENQVGRVYVIRLVTEDGEVVHKIGMTNTPRSADRMMEILRSWFMAFRYVPTARLKLDKETGVPLLLEKHMHELLADLRWNPSKKVDGGTEMFTDVDEEAVLEYLRNFDYRELLKVTKIKSKDYDWIIKELNKDLPEWVPPTIDF